MTRFRDFITGLFIFGVLIGVLIGVTALMHGGASGFIMGAVMYALYRIAMQDAKDIWK